MKDSFVFYKSFHEATKNLPAELYKEVSIVLNTYALTGDVIECSEIAKSFLILMKPSIDKANERHKRCIENGARGGNPNLTQTQPSRNQDTTKSQPTANQDTINAQPTANLDVDVDVDVVNKELQSEYEGVVGGCADAPLTPKPVLSNTKPQKHKYGRYGNVLLTTEEHARLVGEPDGVAAIEHFSYHRQMKGYKCRDDNLAIRKWAFNAVLETRQKEARLKSGGAPPKKHSFSGGTINRAFDEPDAIQF